MDTLGIGCRSLGVHEAQCGNHCPKTHESSEMILLHTNLQITVFSNFGSQNRTKSDENAVNYHALAV